jgi:hypothetical protein
MGMKTFFTVALFAMSLGAQVPLGYTAERCLKAIACSYVWHKWCAEVTGRDKP